MSRKHLLVAAGFLIHAIGAVGMIGILVALMRGEEYSPLILTAVFIYLAGVAILNWADRRMNREAQKSEQTM